MPKLLSYPACGYGRSWVIRCHHRKCKQCRREWSPQSYHPVSGFRILREQWIRIIETFLRDGTIKCVMHECHIAYATAQAVVEAIRKVMTLNVPQPFKDVCEADET